MIVAVTYEDGQVFQHFGRTEQFKLYEIADGAVVSSKVIGNDGLSHGGLVNVLIANKVEAFICGGIGGGARNMIESTGIRLYPGASGDADACVEALISGRLDYDPDTSCNHHDHDHGDHGCTCGHH